MIVNVEPAPYYNYPQLAVKLSSAPHKTCIWGRGTGKTTILADEKLKLLIAMPRCKIAFGGLTYFHVRTKSMPAIIKQFEARKIYRNIHYFVGHKAPKKWNWKEPYMPPLDFANCIHFWNGSVVEFISFDRPEMARSGSYDAMLFDEAAKLKKQAIDSDVLPANRGNRDRFGDVRFHHATMFMTTMPLTPEGEWVFEYEELARHDPRYFYLEASARDNIHILGEQYFIDQRRAMAPIIYDTEIENKRVNFNVNGFYPALSENHLYYDSYNYSFYEARNYEVDLKGGLDCRGDGDCITDLPLYVSFDFGSSQNCCIVAQRHKRKNDFPVIKNFFVENEQLKFMVDQFIRYYRFHRKRIIYLYGGSDGTRKNDAISRKSYFDNVIKWLKAAKFEVELRAHPQEIPHMDKYLFWQKYLSGDYPNLPRFRINGNNANETYFSMDRAPVLPQEIKKDKSMERPDKRGDRPRWQATDLSDAVDNLYYWELSPMVEYNDPSFDMQII
jgi:hypothetical protein